MYDFYYKVYNKLKAALKVPFSLDESMRRVDDTPAHKALREAIANCLTNANYYERRGIVCVWGDDAITIANPDDFRLPIEEARKPGASDPRNETMLKIFSFVNVGERAGSGMGTIESGWVAGGYPAPVYEVAYGPDHTTLTLPLASGDSTGEERSKAVESGRNGLSGAKADIVAALAAAEGPATSTELATAIGLGKTRTNELIGELIVSGHVVAEGATRSRKYRLANG